MESCQNYLQAQRKGESHILFASRRVGYAGRIHKESVGELSKRLRSIFLKCLYLARIGRPDILLVSE